MQLPADRLSSLKIYNGNFISFTKILQNLEISIEVIMKYQVKGGRIRLDDEIYYKLALM